jgi:hypothetical protein
LGLIATAIAIFLTRHRRGREWGPSSLDGTRSDAPLQSPPPMSQEHGSPVHGPRPYVSALSCFPSSGVLHSRNRTLRIRQRSLLFQFPPYPCRKDLDSPQRCKSSPIIVIFRIVVRSVCLWLNGSAFDDNDVYFDMIPIIYDDL